MAEYKGIEYLRKRLAIKRRRVLVRYRYYDLKNELINHSNLIPKNFRWIRPVLGWCAKSVDSLADRIVFDDFVNDNFDISEIFNLNSRDVFFDDAVLSALISSCCFVSISEDSTGYPRIQVIDGSNATGIIDPTTKLLREGYAVLERDDNGRPTVEAYYLPGETYIYRRGEREPERFGYTSPYPLLVPIINRPDAARPFGHSRISRAQIELTQEALRALIRSEVSSEFYSFPQKYILGLDPRTEFDKDKATMADFLNVSKDENGERPTVGQFQQQTMTPYVDYLRMLASVFAGDADLTVDDLGFSTANPATEEAIKASHENLRLRARKAQRTFGTGFLNVGYLAACIRDKREYDRSVFYETKCSWYPIFEPSASALGSVGDAVFKINEAVPGYVGERNMKQLTGLESDVNGS